MTRIRASRETVCIVVESRMGKGKITLQAENGDSIRTVLAKAGYTVGDRIRLVPLAPAQDDFRPIRDRRTPGD